MSDLDFDLDFDFNIDTTNILSDYTIEQLIEELKKRGCEYRESLKKSKGLNIEAKKDYYTCAVIVRKQIERNSSNN